MSKVDTDEAAPSYLVGATRKGSYVSARKLASYWHGGRDHNITGLSHGTTWSTRGLLEELGNLLDTERTLKGLGRVSALAELEALIEFANGHTDIVSVDSAHGHQFLHEDGYESCLTCGAQYELIHTSKSHVNHGRYVNHRGEAPDECTGVELPHDERPQGCNCILCQA